MDILIFDMDGVLIDVSNSYRKTIQKTVHIYLETYLGFQIDRRGLVTNEAISLFKSAGGFNNDWDLTSGLLLYLLSVSGIPPSPGQKKFSSIGEILHYLKTKSSRFPQKKAVPIKKKHLSFFLEEARSSGGGLRGVRRGLRASWDGWVYRTGKIDQENLVKRIFQEIYLGKKFTTYYHLPRLFHKEDGLYRQERLLIPRNILSSLQKKTRMGIASGRPRFEAELALKRFHLLPYFDTVVSLDECEKEEERILRSTGRKAKCSKPHPYSILRVIQKIGLTNPKCGYVGDVVDDMRAAQAAKKYFSMLVIGFLPSGKTQSALMEALLRAGADCIIKNPKEFLQLTG